MGIFPLQMKAVAKCSAAAPWLIWPILSKTLMKQRNIQVSDGLENCKLEEEKRIFRCFSSHFFLSWGLSNSKCFVCWHPVVIRNLGFWKINCATFLIVRRQIPKRTPLGFIYIVDQKSLPNVVRDHQWEELSVKGKAEFFCTSKINLRHTLCSVRKLISPAPGVLRQSY